MRSTLATFSLLTAGALAALGAAPAHADPRISIQYHEGCYTLWIEALSFPLFCYPPPL